MSKWQCHWWGIASHCKCLQLDLTKCIGQGYDCASSMAGQRAGAAARFEVEAPDAHYYDCAMHCLNLSSAKAITVQFIRQAQDVIKDITSCFRSSAKRTDLLKSCIHDEEDTRIFKTQLVTLCTTRFVEGHTSVVCLRSLLKYVMAALQRMSDWQSPDARKTAIILMNSIEESSFVVSLVVLELLSGLLLPTTRQLQKPSPDIVFVMDNFGVLTDTLRQMRSADKSKELFAEASLVANMLDIKLSKPRLASRSIYRAAAGGTDQSVEQYFRINVFYPAIDSIVTDLELRFGERQQRVVELARLIPAFMLKNSEDNWSVVESVISVHGHLLEDPMVVVRCEYNLWQRKWSNV